MRVIADAMIATVLPPGARMSIRIDAISDELYRMQFYDISADRVFNITNTFT